MKRYLASFLMAVLCTAAHADIVVWNSAKGPVKPMNAVNNGPVTRKVDQHRDNFQSYSDCCFPFARTHDSSFESEYGGEHTVDISAIFPDFSKDVNNPASYDFTMTDHYLGSIRDAGTQVFYRLGQKIEHGKKKYNIYPPEDYFKWAQVCEHIIRHYNEGWADGYHWDILYWEIWNEADLDWKNDVWKTNPRTWGGSAEQFFEFYATVATHLGKCFPDLKIGGPAMAGMEDWARYFLGYMSDRGVRIDFFSWHAYERLPERMSSKAMKIRRMLDESGYADSESILNEWNYMRNWTDAFKYSLGVISGVKGAAFASSVMQLCQDQPVDMLMYYDARPCSFNGIFDPVTFSERESYYTFYAWNKLVRLGTQLEAGSDEADVYVTAATDGHGRSAVLLSRFNDDANVVASKKVRVNVSDLSFTEAVSHITDSVHIYTEQPVHFIEAGVIELVLEPQTVVLIELR